jgi:hypothetical protein
VRSRSTRRLPAAAGTLVALAVATLAACTGGGSGSDAAEDSKAAALAGNPSVSPAPPGKYQTLPQPCGTVGLGTLKKLVPGLEDYAGTESLTYDTDRRVGCGWTSRASDGTGTSLRVDLERVVSYDPQVSDEVQATTEFEKEQSEASIPASPSHTGPATTEPAGGSPGDSADVAPRQLTNVGNTAFINDQVHTVPVGHRRDVSLVFRTANVLVSVSYSQSSGPHDPSPSSVDLQEGAQQVAGQLEKKVTG